MTYAGECRWWYACDSASIDIQYCKDGTCSLSGSVDATKKLAWGLFTEKPLAAFAQDVVRYLLGFVTIIGVIYVIYAGFQLMTGGGDEEKVKKARQIIIYVLVGIVLMWLAYAIVQLIIWAIDSKK